MADYRFGDPFARDLQGNSGLIKVIPKRIKWYWKINPLQSNLLIN